MPPRSFNHCVYTILPGATSTSFAQTRFSTRAASGTFEAEFGEGGLIEEPHGAADAAVFVGAVFEPVLAAIAVLVDRGFTPAGAYQLARSQPNASPKHAPASPNRSCTADLRTPRAVSYWRKGQCVAYSRPRLS